MLVLVGVSTRSMAESAVRAGYPVVAVDYFGDLDQRRLCWVLGMKTDAGVVRPSARTLFEAVRALSPTGVVYSSPFENHPELVRGWEEEGILLGNTSATLIAVRDHRRLARCLARVGIRTPLTLGRGVGEWDQAAGAAKLWVEKPERSGGGHGVRLTRMACRPPAGRLLQEFVPGVPASATFLADGRTAVVVGTSRQISGAPGLGARGFRYAGSIVPLALPRHFPLPQVEREIRTLVSALVADFRLRGINTVDLVVNRAGVHVVEVNPRWSASAELIERRAGVSLFDLHVRACRGDLPSESAWSGPGPLVVAETAPGPFWGKAIVYAPRAGSAPALADPDLEELWQGGVRDIPCPGVRMGPGQPVCTVLVCADDYRGCWRSLLDRAGWARDRCWRPFEAAGAAPPTGGRGAPGEGARLA